MNILGCISVPSYEATGIDGGSVLTFSSALPDDGSVTFAFITLDPSFASYSGSRTQMLAYFCGGDSNGNIGISKVGVGTVAAYLPTGWAWFSATN